MVNIPSGFSGHIRALTLFLFLTTQLFGQQSTTTTGNEIDYPVTEASQRLEMIVNTSRILTLDKEVPRAMVNNPDIVRVVPLSPNRVQISASKPGVTQVNLWDEDGKLYSVSVLIIGDAQELDMLLKAEFPQASLRVRPLSSSVVLSGRVDRTEDVSRIVRMAEDYYPKVINNITVGGVQQVLLHVQVMEVSRTKLRAMGFDWANFSGNNFVVQSVSGTLGNFTQAGSASGSGTETMSFGLIGPGNSFFGFLEALRDQNLAKVLAEPKLTTVSGRPASFNVGGEFPILVPQSLGTLSVDYKQFGTRVDFVPIVLGNGGIRLEVRPQVSELDSANGVTLNGNRIPGLRTRWVDTAVEMRSGQTLALAGLLQTRVESQNVGLPWLADLPWAGAAFRRVRESKNEVELVVTVRPELVDALDPTEVPPCMPGSQSTSPNDVELYFRGYMEVPNCCPEGCATSASSGMPYEGQAVEVPAASYPVETPATAPAANQSGSYSPAAKSGKSIRPVTHSISGRQIRSTGKNGKADAGQDDPGLFGRVGYDVLE